MGLTACANIVTNASNSNQVTLISSGTESMERLTQQANAYCQQYGKKASFKEKDSQFINIFNCN
jgi:acetylornithine/succinyldiaminopimelate/putrescine aminotransferase